MTKQTGDGGPRKVPPRSCTWCGHKPHTGTCPSKIRTDPKTAETPCPCTRHLRQKDPR